MIRRVTVHNFKRFSSQEFDLSESVVLAGPNNAGKSTLLQAIATWKFAVDRWVAGRGQRGGQYKSVPITRNDFTAVPLREMNLLWTDRTVSGGGIRRTLTPTRAAPPGASRPIGIHVEGGGRHGDWRCGIELRYANREMVYVRPAPLHEDGREETFPPQGARDIDVVHVPPLSGIRRDEPRYERGMQNLFVGQARPGDILRNLLWEIAETDADGWKSMVRHIRDLFWMELLRPEYSPDQPFLNCQYRDRGRRRELDLSNAGSGTLQVMLLLAFLYARPGSVLLLDEPDAHQHVILQKQVYVLLRKIARQRRGQVVVATHSEVLLDATTPSGVLAFVGDSPRLLASKSERDQIREALKSVSTVDLLRARESGAVLYLEGSSDETILREWARILDHPARQFLENGYVHHLGGRRLKYARAHLFALRGHFPAIRAVCLLDGDMREELESETLKSGLLVSRWHRYEIENYLLQPSAIVRFLEDPEGGKRAVVKFWQLVPQNTDLFGDHVALVNVKASGDFLVPLFEEVGRPTPKHDLYLLAGVMRPDEIHPEVVRKLDQIAQALGPPHTGDVDVTDRQLTPDRMANLADGLVGAIAKIEKWGIPVPPGSRLQKTVQLLRSVASENTFPQGPGDLIEIAHAARDAQEMTEISHVIPVEMLDPVAEALRRTVGGSLGQSPHQAYQSQSELWVGAMLARGGAFTGVIENAKHKSPDFVVRNGNMEYSVEVKRPASLAGAQALVSGAAKQLLSKRFHGGALVVDLTDCLDPGLAAVVAPGPPDLRRVQAQIHRQMDRLRKEVYDDSSQRIRGKRRHLFGVTVIARVIWWDVDDLSQMYLTRYIGWISFLGPAKDLRYWRARWLAELIDKGMKEVGHQDLGGREIDFESR